MDAIALMAMCDLIAQATPFVVAFAGFTWLVWWIAPYLHGGNSENDYL